MAFITGMEHWKYCSHWRPVLTKLHSHCLPGKMRSRLLSLSGVGWYRNGSCMESHFQKMHAYENHAFHGRHCKVSPSPNPHQHTSKSVKHRVIRNQQTVIRVVSNIGYLRLDLHFLTYVYVEPISGGLTRQWIKK